MTSKHGFVAASRPHDYIYDPVFTVPTPKDVHRAAAIAAQKVAETHLRPSFTCMFSELRHFPSAFAVKSYGRLPIAPPPKPICSSINSQTFATAREVTGIDRHKYFTSALEGTEDLHDISNSSPLIRRAPVTWRPELEEVSNVGSQLRTSLAEPPPPPPPLPRPSLPKLKDAATQTVYLKRCHESIERRGASAERAIVFTRAKELEKATTWRMQRARELRNEHAADASEFRAARREKLHNQWVSIRGEELSRMMKKHNRELRKLTREFGIACPKTPAAEHLDPGSHMYAPPLRLGAQKLKCERLGLPSINMPPDPLTYGRPTM